MRFKNNKSTISIKKFKQATVIMNLVVVTQFFETVYT